MTMTMTMTTDSLRVRCPYCNRAHDDDESEPCPSPESIREACLAIQATWDERERNRRRAFDLADPLGESLLGRLTRDVHVLSGIPCAALVARDSRIH